MNKLNIHLEKVTTNPDGTYTAMLNIEGGVVEGPSRATFAEAKRAGMLQIIGICNLVARETLSGETTKR